MADFNAIIPARVFHGRRQLAEGDATPPNVLTHGTAPISDSANSSPVSPRFLLAPPTRSPMSGAGVIDIDALLAESSSHRSTRLYSIASSSGEEIEVDRPVRSSRLYSIPPPDEHAPRADEVPVHRLASPANSPPPSNKDFLNEMPDLGLRRNSSEEVARFPPSESQPEPRRPSMQTLSTHSEGSGKRPWTKKLQLSWKDDKREPTATSRWMAPGRKKPPKRWKILLYKAKKKCKHAPGSSKYIEACRMVLSVQQRFSSLWLHLQTSRAALDAFLDAHFKSARTDTIHSVYGKEHVEELPPDQEEEENLAELATRFRHAADTIASIPASESDHVDWATLGLYLRYRNDGGYARLDEENINLQDWKAIAEQLGKTEEAMQQALRKQRHASSSHVPDAKCDDGSDAEPLSQHANGNGVGHADDEEATSAWDLARELQLCSSVRALVQDLLIKVIGNAQWRLLLELLHRVCGMQDFLDAKKKEWLANPAVPFKESFFGSYGPVGDLPLHLIFLMGMDVFCRDCILTVYAVPGSGRLDLPYISDLWMALDEESFGLQNARARWMKEGWLRPGEHDASSMGMFTGETVLHIAIAKKRLAGLRLLLENGVDLSCRTAGQFFAPDRVMPFRKQTRKAAALFTRKQDATIDGRLPVKAELAPAMAEERYTFMELLKATSFAQMWDGGYPLLQNPMSGFYGGELPLSFAASVNDTRIMSMLLDHLKEGVWLDWEATRHKEIKRKETRFLMTMNPVWSSAMAAGEVEQRQLREAWQETRGNFMNAKDSFGNTALHLAVMHNRQDAVDWLIANGALSSLTTLNVNGYTPFTLTAALGNPDMFIHILTKHMRRILWSYGPISSVHTNLAQVDTFRMSEPKVPAHKAAQANATVKALSGEHCWSLRRYWYWLCEAMSSTRETARGMSWKCILCRRQPQDSDSEDEYFEDDDDSLHPHPEHDALAEEKLNQEGFADKFNERTIAALHSDPSWRSALEIIIHQEIEPFMAENESVKGLVKDLVRQKWDSFGRRMHITKRVLPYLVFVLCWTTICVLRSGQVRVQTLQKQMDVDNLNEVQSVMLKVLEAVVVFLGVPVLLRSAWSNMRTKISDLDVNLDGSIETNEKILFLYKNMSSLLDLFSALCIVFCALLRAAGMQSTELDIMAVVSVVIWCNILTCFVPFKVFGTMVITIHKMLVGDVAIFLVVYILINVAFGLAIFICMQGGVFPQDIDLQEQLRCVGCDAYFGSMVLKLVWVSLGETEQTPLIAVTRSPGLAACLHIVFVVLSLILLLNLIIAMMGDTYQKQFNQAEKDWFFPYAELVLRYESKLSPRHKCKYRVGTPIAMNSKQHHVGSSMTFHWREELLQS